MKLADYVEAYEVAINKRDESEQYRIEKTVRQFGVDKPMLIVLMEARKTTQIIRR